MRRLLLSSLLLLASLAGAQAQCISVAGASGPAPIFGVTCPSEPTIPSYTATGVAIVAAATPTDIACLTGGVGVVARLNKVLVSATISTQVVVPVLLTKNLVADTGGTPATGTALPVPFKMDSTFAAPVATTTAFTANPTVTAGAGLVASGLLIMSKADGTNGAVAPYTTFDFTEPSYMAKPNVRGVAQQLCVNLNATAATMTGNLINVTFNWTEAAQ